ncbi:MAG: transcriptional regulator, TetR family [Sphaerisporangium sp.]|nr:transcriptional regulator, TetR family [Sphaerisporangium sp.]
MGASAGPACVSPVLEGSVVAQPEDWRPVRANARRNRDKLLSAALEEFTRCGNEASLEGIARRADVGIATLYRHFPTREALVLAAYRHEVEQLCGTADALLRTLPPDQALREWMDRLASYTVTKQHMSEALHAASSSGGGSSAESYAKVFSTLDGLLAAAVEAGTIRSDMETGDVMLAMTALMRLDTSKDWQAQARRLLDLLMDGLRAGSRDFSREDA